MYFHFRFYLFRKHIDGAHLSPLCVCTHVIFYEYCVWFLEFISIKIVVISLNRIELRVIWFSSSYRRKKTHHESILGHHFLSFLFINSSVKPPETHIHGHMWNCIYSVRILRVKKRNRFASHTPPFHKYSEYLEWKCHRLFLFIISFSFCCYCVVWLHFPKIIIWHIFNMKWFYICCAIPIKMD